MLDSQRILLKERGHTQRRYTVVVQDGAAVSLEPARIA
jgi:hypothetical protein